ncbi:hypothetical protein BDV30DRAFT_237552 [Aspergillus minisclerotigenes]|uniref:Uncharacterized protein n=1 Tax=Aspergillus minisclerotigenes TaxID=656917 RepID=A0A5N6J6Y3_9EURO|nr:hypothetical protein BDV30DRAFT_237552 [Aspergillus minisclerotigenes]
MADSKKLDTQEIHERCNPLTVANDPNRWLPESGSDTSYTSSREGTPSTADTSSQYHQELQALREAQEAQEHLHYAIPDDGIKSSGSQPYRECAETAIRQFLWTLVLGGIQQMEVPSSPRKMVGEWKRAIVIPVNTKEVRALGNSRSPVFATTLHQDDMFLVRRLHVEGISSNLV